jgi:hypothetical protein
VALVPRTARVADSPNFVYGEFPGWDSATRAQLDGLDLLVDTIMQPARSATGLRFYPTSWLRPRQGSSIHPLGAAVDFAAGPDRVGAPPTREDSYNAWLWIAQNIPHRVGELIYEQPKPPGVTGHVHVTLPGYGGRSELMYQTADKRLLVLDPFSLAVSGELQPGRPGELGSETDPYELPEIVVTVSRYGWAPWFLGGVLGAVLLSASRRK